MNILWGGYLDCCSIISGPVNVKQIKLLRRCSNLWCSGENGGEGGATIRRGYCSREGSIKLRGKWCKISHIWYINISAERQVHDARYCTEYLIVSLIWIVMKFMIEKLLIMMDDNELIFLFIPILKALKPLIPGFEACKQHQRGKCRQNRIKGNENHLCCVFIPQTFISKAV